MPLHSLKADFSKGEITPLAHARQDKEFYAASLAKLVNFSVLRYGGIRRCSGTRYAGTTKNQAQLSRLIPFVFSEDQVFFLEFGNLYIRFWLPDGSQVLSGMSPYEVVTPYLAADVDDVQFVQNGDTIFLAHPNYPPAQLQRVTNTNWAYAPVTFIDGPYGAVNDTVVTVSSSAIPAALAVVNLTWSAITPINKGAGFTAADIGRHVRIAMGNNWAWGRITVIVSTTVVTVNIVESAITVNTPTPSWRLGMVAASQGYFGSVAFYKGRAVWARTSIDTRTIAFSMANLPFRFTPTSLIAGTVTDDNGFTVPVISGRADEILWLQEQSSLIYGTASSVRSIRPDDGGGAFGPRNFREQIEVFSGTHPVQPAPVGSSTVHCGRFGLTVRDLFFDYRVESLVAPELSTLSDHLLRQGIKSLAYAQSPVATLWMLLEDGRLIGATYDRDEDVVGFYERKFVNGFVESIAIVPNYAEKRDVLGIIVRRTVNEETVRYIELVQPEYIDSTITPKEDAWFVDSGILYDGVPTNSIEGLDHLEAETVCVYADGAVYPNAVVTDGEITLPNTREASKILVGLPLTARADGLRMPVNSNSGSQYGLNKRVPYAVVSLFETSGVVLGSKTTGKKELIVLRKPSNPTNTAPPLFSGTVRVTIEDTFENDGQLFLECPQPLPATILGVNAGVEIQP
jgi:hypothetical protein